MLRVTTKASITLTRSKNQINLTIHKIESSPYILIDLTIRDFNFSIQFTFSATKKAWNFNNFTTFLLKHTLTRYRRASHNEIQSTSTKRRRKTNRNVKTLTLLRFLHSTIAVQRHVGPSSLADTTEVHLQCTRETRRDSKRKETKEGEEIWGESGGKYWRQRRRRTLERES